MLPLFNYEAIGVVAKGSAIKSFKFTLLLVWTGRGGVGLWGGGGGGGVGFGVGRGRFGILGDRGKLMLKLFVSVDKV